jgi:hypothetical protein
MNTKEIICKIQQLQSKFYELAGYQIDNNPFGDVIIHFQSYLFESANIEAVDEDIYVWTVFIDGDEYGGYVNKDVIENENVNMYRISVLFLKDELKRLRMEQKNTDKEYLEDYIENEIFLIEETLEKLMCNTAQKLTCYGFDIPKVTYPYLEMIEFLTENKIHIEIKLIYNLEWNKPKYEYDIRYLGKNCIMMDGQKLEYLTRRECIDAAIKEAINYL